MAQAHPENRDLGEQPCDDVHRLSRRLRTARPRRHHEMGRLQLPCRVDIDVVVGAHDHFGTQDAQGLHHVVGERVVVVDQQDPAHRPPAALSRAPRIAPLLERTSSHSVLGTLSATIPAPAWYE